MTTNVPPSRRRPPPSHCPPLMAIQNMNCWTTVQAIPSADSLKRSQTTSQSQRRHPYPCRINLMVINSTMTSHQPRGVKALQK